MTMYSSVTEAKNKVIKIAKGEVGYLEKASNSSLDSNSGNAGYNNWTKYWRDIYPGFQTQPWCACFVSWVFAQAFGKDLAAKLLKHWPFTYCPTLASMTENKAPKVGSVILFYRNGTYAHTGIVYKVASDKVYTIEGNTSGSSGIVANGGGVFKKSYYRSQLSCLTKYFMPDYSLVVSAGSPANTSSGATASKKDPVKETAAAEKNSTVTNPASKTSSQICDIPQWTGVVTASALNVRKWAGVEYSRIQSYPMLTRGEEVGVCDVVYANNGDPWYFVKINNLWYGFVHSSYIKKV